VLGTRCDFYVQLRWSHLLDACLY